MLLKNWLGLILGTSIVAAAACSAGSNTQLDDDGSGAGKTNGAGGGDGGTSFTTGNGGGSTCDLSCSTDLHSVIDCDGNLVTQCPDDQGCGESGQCVPACDSAAQNASTFGCDFYSVTPAVIAESRGSCFAVMVANTWTSPITVQATYGGQTINTANYLYVPQGQGNGLTYQPTNGTLQAGQLGIIFLSKYESGDIFQVDCPVAQALEMSTQVDNTGLGQAFQITTDRPIVAYDVYPWGGASSFVTSATLLLPTPTWGTNFVTVDAWEALNGNPWTQVVASQDNTTVTMVPVTNVQGGGGLNAMPANQPTSFTLNRGQVAQFLQTQRLAGSILQADKPVSVWGGASCMNIPNSAVACDAAHQQLLPVQTLGSIYAAVRYPPRGGGNDSAPFTIVGVVDGTNLTYDPAPPPGAPPTLAKGQVVIVDTDQKFVVSSQDEDHPFYMAAHMTGGSLAGDLGDPEYTNLVPPPQFLDFYLFATDPTYRYTALVFVRQRGADGNFHEVNLDCLGTVSGWQPLGTAGAYEYAQVMLVDNGNPVNGCNNGAHTANSDLPFGLTVWGYDSYASYGYPAGMAVDTINTVVVPPIPQ
ncbi:MAG: IgGFc-binding protein [Myxococcales bacterium]|nr:IgGFc-binding protein [Myxococcales bacterium]